MQQHRSLTDTFDRLRRALDEEREDRKRERNAVCARTT
jgi:hypothetical protein